MGTSLRIQAAIAASIILIAGAAPASATGTLSATPSTIAGATLASTVPTDASPLGVSPDVYVDETTGTFYLYTTSRPPKTYTSRDGATWAEVSDAQLPPGSDWSVVKMGPDDYRMYYSAIVPNATPTVRCASMKRGLYYATSTDLTHWKTQQGPILDDVGCGVPHVIRKPDSTFLLYYNTITTQHGIHIATSNDGLSWTKLPGLIANNPELVDPAPLIMPDGTFLMVSSTTGGGKGPQELQILSSANGIDWNLRSTDLLAIPGVSVLDPSLKLVNGQLRLWFGYAPDMNHDNSRIANGILTLGSVPAAVVAKPGTSCVKAGTKATFQGKPVICKKTKGTLVWVRVR